jgi:eukaryotic-like serine/threonine-protein kinase
LVNVQRLADAVLEDCLARQLDMFAALDVFLAQCGRMIHAAGGFVELRGVHGPVLTRLWGERVNAAKYARWNGAVKQDDGRTLFVSPLELGALNFGALGFLVAGDFQDNGALVLQLVEAIGETLDSAVLSFLGASGSEGPLERLDLAFKPGVEKKRGALGGYELLTPLGTGGMAQVMVAKKRGPQGVGRLVALKRMLPHLTADRNVVDQFLDEARLGMRLAHPNLVTFLDFGEDAGGYYIAMELLKGADFDYVIYSPPSLPLPHIVSGVVCQALDGLHAAHEARAEDGGSMGLVHRDLSPHNLMVCFDGRVKVLDFGVAKMRNQRTVTLPGIVKGKPLYMSPEQAVGERVDRRSDIFAMGLILHEALSGKRAFDKGNDTKTMEAIVNEPLARPPGLKDEHWSLIERALAKEPNKRFRDAVHMKQVLSEKIRPANEHEIGLLVRERFADRVAQFQKWDALA